MDGLHHHCLGGKISEIGRPHVRLPSSTEITGKIIFLVISCTLRNVTIYPKVTGKQLAAKKGVGYAAALESGGSC